MRHIYIVGIGTGNPEHLTVQAINTLNKVDVIFIPSKGASKAELAEVRRGICQRYVTNEAIRVIDYAVPVRQTADRSYVQSVDDWHSELSATYERLFQEHIQENGSAAFLVWGDPSLYDSTIRIIERVSARKQVVLDYSVVPGITSIQALTASHRIPLNLVGKPVQITTGRRLAESFPGMVETAVVMLDGEQAFGKIDDPDAYIYWGAYLGTEDEITIAGRLADVSDRIVATRAEARTRHGWIMDIYLLRKGQDFDDPA
ncbi:precorrin-6A synthase (deacetylating) [Rhizobium sp. RCC_161_2]|uniref:precorrin-6A synthase (deacetylating) n=1 Tax=Rhizobium sp. RCC_161_2 TaxID=3239219 RepID=UPI003524B1FE